MRQIKQISEFGTIWNKKDFVNDSIQETFDCIYLDGASFQNLVGFVAENNDTNSEVEQAFSFHRKRGKDFIRVKNFVGVLETRRGTVIEVLPKIYNDKSLTDIEKKSKSKTLLFKMLRTLRNAPFKSIDQAHLKASKVPIIEVFIAVFIMEMELLLKKGIKHFYNSLNRNQRFLKGRLLFTDNLKHNLSHREKFFVQYDEYNADIPQNRILKATLIYLKEKSRSSKNISEIQNLLSLFEDVRMPPNIEKDLLKINGQSRLFSHYQTVLQWAKVFLLNKSFLSYNGNHLNTAILFPMETLFESYAAYRIKQFDSNWEVSIQDRKHYLLHDLGLDTDKFRLKPDIVIKTATNTTIADTKWKLINEDLPKINYNISQSDMYQLYAYGKKYQNYDENIHLVLIYPKSETFTNSLHFKFESNLFIDAIPFDFEEEQSSLSMLNELAPFIERNPVTF
ncbi:McrC family protein [Maribellus mangrovi]|uniref:McrC family protein n=1 Tax=Maribellus mangrovi TaxID=3133146 RepID=UPI0030EE42AB